jgi:hypothetical protein
MFKLSSYFSIFLLASATTVYADYELVSNPVCPTGQVKDEWIVKVRPSVAGRNSFAKSFSPREQLKNSGLGEITKDLSRNLPGLYVAKGNPIQARQSVLSGKSQSEFEYVEPNCFWKRPQKSTNDPGFPYQWGLKNTGQKINTTGTAGVDIDIEKAWAITQGDPNIIVGIMDGLPDTSHPDLNANFWVNPGEVPGNKSDDDRNYYVDDYYGLNLFSSNGDTQAPDTHGTHVSGIVGAVSNNSTGVTGVAPKAKLISLAWIGEFGGSQSDMLEAAQYAIEMKKRGVNIRVINGSFGFDYLNVDPNYPIPPEGYRCSSSDQNMLDAFNQNGIVFTKAAGNENNNNDIRQYGLSNCISPSLINVTGVDNNGNLPYPMSYGPNTVQVAAPGADILSTIPYSSSYSSYDLKTGSSMATPHVAGIAALILSIRPDLTPGQVRDAIMNSVKPLASLAGKIQAPGIVSAYGALLEAQKYPGTATPTATPVPSPTSTPSPTPTATPTPSSEPPAAVIPTAPKVKAKISKGLVTLTWKLISGATSYKIYRSTKVGTLGKLIKIVKTNSFSQKIPKSKGSFFYSVQSLNKSAQGNPSKQLKIFGLK